MTHFDPTEDEQQEVRVLLALDQVEEALPMLRRLALAGRDPATRRWAVNELTGLGPSAVPEMLEVLDQTNDPGLGIRLAEAVLGAAPEPATRERVSAWLAANREALDEADGLGISMASPPARPAQPGPPASVEAEVIEGREPRRLVERREEPGTGAAAPGPDRAVRSSEEGAGILPAPEQLDQTVSTLTQLVLGAAGGAIRRWAIDQLATLGPSAAPSILRVLETTSDPDAARRLAEILLESVPDTVIQRRVAAWLATRGEAAHAVEMLTTLAQSEGRDEREAEEALIELLELAEGDPRAVDAITQVAQSAPHQVVRQRALLYLLRGQAQGVLSLGLDLDEATRQQLVATLTPLVEFAADSSLAEGNQWQLPGWLLDEGVGS
ncbi:MAG TPA: hypothetical protein VER55_07675 [Ardenticatenaceae bacterium]|nr:hypothetical protein [Ardenticatenaceae bacterium]